MTDQPRSSAGTLVAILPCNDLDASERFYARLRFKRPPDYTVHGKDDYRILSNGRGGHLHLNRAVEGWVVPGRNPFGLYLYVDNVDEVAAAAAGDGKLSDPEHKPWGMYEFALSDPDGTLVRVGWPSSLVKAGSV